MPVPRARECDGADGPARSPLALLLTVIAWVGILPPAAAQTPPGPAGYQVGQGLDLQVAGRRGLGWWNEFSITTQATLTNNANYGTSGVREGDLVLELIPTWSFHREGARLRVDGQVALDMLGYVNGVQVSSILPQANIRANLEAIENLFFVDASILVDQLVENPFLPSSQYSSTNNLYTTTNARLAPYFKGNIGQYVSWQVRSDNTFTWTSQSDNPLQNAYYVRNLAEVVRAPIPLGLTLRLTNDLTRIQDQVQPDQTLNTALAIVDYAFTPQFTFGLRAGYENTTYTAIEEAGPIYGANLSWQPSPTSSLVGYWEERFYGPNYQFLASHRQRRLASSGTFYRTITTFPQVLLQIPPTGSVAGLLNAILVARFPDPTVRQQQVLDLINRQALPEALPAGAFIYNQSANILTGGNVNFALLGVRNTLALNIFYLKTALLPDPRVPPTFLAFNNNNQIGASITLSHQLTPIINLNGTVSGYETKGVGPTEGLETRQGLASLQVNWRLSPRDTVFGGTRYQFTKNESATVQQFGNTSEAAIFVGLFHSFSSISSW